MVKSFNFLAPSLHPNTLLDIAIPLAGPSAPEPSIRSLPVKYGGGDKDAFMPLGLSQAMCARDDSSVLVGDNASRLSTINLERDSEGHYQPPQIVKQHQMHGKPGNNWAGIVQVKGGNVAAVATGNLSFIPSSTSADQAPRETRVMPSLKCIAAPSTDATTFAVAGREVDVSIYDVERTFRADRALPDISKERKTPRRGASKEKVELQDGEIWRAKNVAHDELGLRVPIHHLCMTFNPQTASSLYTGTQSGCVRHYDTRQRKPISNWKVAREGGVGSVAFSSMQPHELFFADRSELFGAIDLRTGRLLYSVKQPVSVHHMITFDPTPAKDGSGTRQIGLAGLGSDAALRIYATTPSPEYVDGKPPKGNWGSEKKGVMAGMAGGVGPGSFLFRGYGEMEDRKEEKKVKGGEREDKDDGDEEEAGEEVWDGMDEVADEGDESKEDADSWDEDSDDEDERPKKKSKGKVTAGKGPAPERTGKKGRNIGRKR